MKCPKCGYTSFDYLDECKKCGKSLEEHKEKYNIRSLMFPATGAAVAGAAAAGAAAPAAGGDEEFGFDFMEEEGAAGASPEPTTEVTEDDTFDFGEEDDSFSFDDDDSF
ncbi:MAG: hypothetical protein GWN87_26650 [Desulfuromonadales bacterium]|nr:hypothetical protein [Desulfuromonadales bacterium]